MNKLLKKATGLLGVGLALVLAAHGGQAQQLPTAPGMGTPNQSPKPSNREWMNTPGQQPPPPNKWVTVPAEEPNRDLLVTAAAGPWMILLISYVEQEEDDVAPVARDLIEELRTVQKLPAFTFNYGLQERRNEIARVRNYIEEKKAQYQQQGLDANTPIRGARFTHIKIEYGVLIGGYPTKEAAAQQRERLKSCKLSDAKRYRLEAVYVPDEHGVMRCAGYRNPFHYSLVVRNPALPTEKISDQDKLDVALLRRLNEDESYSLFKNPKPYTLAVKQYQLPSVTQPKSSQGSFLNSIGLGGNTADPVDTAAKNAHIMAEALRSQSNLDAYVLHTQYASVVTVGSFESAEDPRMQAYQAAVANHNNRIRIKGGDPGLIGLFPVARPMAVPR